MRLAALALGVGLVVAGNSALAQWNGTATPHDGRHLVVVRPGDFRLAAAKGAEAGTAKALAGLASPKLTPDTATAFGSAVPLTGPFEAAIRVAKPGTYVVWLRASGREGKPLPIAYALTAGAKSLLAGNLAERKPSQTDGGPVAYAAYAEEAQKTLPGAKSGDGTLAASGNSSKTEGRSDLSGAAAEFEEELLADIAKEKGQKIKKGWVHFTRLEAAEGDRPYYWWKLGDIELEPGTYTLKLTPTAEFRKPIEAPTIDAGFLSTSDEIQYPYFGDINAPLATYIRFRLDKLPEAGITITAGMRIHYDPWSTPGVSLNPGGMANNPVPHTAAGYTPWYRLQDIERAPPFGPSEAHLLLTIERGKKRNLANGATQFAVFPHDDYVLREIDWDEPESSRITLFMDIATYPEKLRTFRDHARENYDRAIAATGDRVFPLTRGELYFSNAWGNDNGDSAPYMVKTLRLLGFNCAADTFDPIRNRKLYGWSSHTGEYWPPASVPYDEAATKREYAKFYEHHFDAQRELYEGVSIFQLADEPGEISREEMSAPLWRFRKDKEGEKYVDVVGNSSLGTKKVDYPACVVEGVVEKTSGSISFRVATDHPTDPQRYIQFSVGKVSISDEYNVATYRAGFPTKGESVGARPGAAIGVGPAQFKLVFDPPAAALYLNGKLIQTQNEVPSTGGFAIVGPAKVVRALRIREIGKDEHVTSADAPDVQVAVKKKSSELDDLDEIVGEKKTATWTTDKPLRKAVAEDWVIGGGIPAAQAGFRRWAQEQGLKPELFGQKSWDDVRMLTVPALVESPAEARLFYWSRRYSGYLTPRMFALAADAIRNAAPNKSMRSFVALSGHALYFPSAMPLDMFQLASGSPAMMPGVSDWMSYGGWRWDSHQAVAYSVAMYNAGARQYGKEPLSYPMMHCVWPSEMRAYTMLANNVRYVSFYNFGPYYQVTEGFWSEDEGSYQAVHRATNRAAQVDDVLSQAKCRPSRVAMLYSLANEYWDAQSSFADKRASFLGLAHEYYQPELVTAEQVAAGALEHYDALYVLEPRIETAAAEKIAGWVKSGGLLWACADAGMRNEFNEPHDLLAELSSIRREEQAVPQATEGKVEVSTVDPNAKRIAAAKANAETPLRMSPVEGAAKFRPHTVNHQDLPSKIEPGTALVRAKYEDGRPAWLEQKVGKGRLVYIGHRAGLTYTSKAARRGGYPVIWADTGRALLTTPLAEAKVERELILSEPLVMAAPMSSEPTANDAGGTVVILYNMRGKTLENVAVSLRETKRPHAVEYFVGDRLQPLEFEHADGRVKFTLPTLETGQMVRVRRSPEPEDDRLVVQQKLAEEQLAATDWQSISAGAWFAGFHPEWKLADRVIPHLKHEHWEVRRVAAEALGRLREPSAADPLVELIESEQDSHVLGDAIFALGRIGDRRVDRLATKLATHKYPFVRWQAARAVQVYYRPADGWTNRPPLTPSLKGLMADVRLADTDSRVRQTTIDLIALLLPETAVEILAKAADPAAAEFRDRAAWAKAIAGNDAALAAYIKQKLPGGDAALLVIAAHRRDTQLAQAINARLGDLLAGDAPALSNAVMHQCDPQLTAALYARRTKLPPVLENALPVLLERTYDARRGAVYEDWTEFVK